MGTFRIDSSTRSRNCLPVSLEWSGGSQKTLALLDSGAEENFLDASTADRWGIPLVEVCYDLCRKFRFVVAVVHLCWMHNYLCLVPVCHRSVFPVRHLKRPPVLCSW